MVEFTADDNSEGIFDDFCIFSYISKLSTSMEDFGPNKTVNCLTYLSSQWAFIFMTQQWRTLDPIKLLIASLFTLHSMWPHKVLGRYIYDFTISVQFTLVKY